MKLTKEKLMKEIKEYRGSHGYAQDSHEKGRCATCDAIRVLDKCEEFLEGVKS